MNQEHNITGMHMVPLLYFPHCESSSPMFMTALNDSVFICISPTILNPFFPPHSFKVGILQCSKIQPFVFVSSMSTQYWNPLFTVLTLASFLPRILRHLKTHLFKTETSSLLLSPFHPTSPALGFSALVKSPIIPSDIKKSTAQPLSPHFLYLGHYQFRKLYLLNSFRIHSQPHPAEHYPSPGAILSHLGSSKNCLVTLVWNQSRFQVQTWLANS